MINELKKLSSPESNYSVYKWHLLQKIPSLQPLWNQMAKQLIEILVILGKQ